MFKADIILHEAGIPPIHTPYQELLKLDSSVRADPSCLLLAEEQVLFVSLRGQGSDVE